MSSATASQRCWVRRCIVMAVEAGMALEGAGMVDSC